MRRSAPFLAALFLILAGCGPTPAPQPPSVPKWALHITTQPGAAARILDGPNALQLGSADPSGHLTLPNLVQSGFTLCVAAEGYRERCEGITLTRETTVDMALERLAPVLPTLRASTERVFRTTTGAAWRWRGVSAFKLMALWERGENIDGFLDDFKGFNVLRVWLYVQGPAWGNKAWDTKDVGVIKRFCDYVKARGWFVELTLLTDDKADRVAFAKALIPKLADAPRPTNLFIEVGNEPTTHKNIPTREFRSLLAGAGFQHASGDYEDSDRAFGTYGVHHSARNDDWPRRAHDCMEFYSGGGPHKKSDPAHKYPWVLDEPGKPQDVGQVEGDWLAYFGGASLMCAGATYHCENCKYGVRPNATERKTAAWALKGLMAFPEAAPLGHYDRIVEDGQSREGRTYVIGRYMVRSQQKGTSAPQPGWKPLDSVGVLWTR